LFAAWPLAAQVDVLTQHNDNARSGTNLKETELNTSNVSRTHFGKLAVRAVDGNVYAQPLIVSGAKIVHRAGPTNTVIVATEHNSVYAFDADDMNPASTSAELWHTGPKILGKHIETSELYTRIGSPTCEDLTTEIGITGTPAIQITKADTPKRGVIYVAAKSKGSAGYRYKLFTLDLATGRVISDVTIQGGVAGTGIGSIGEGKKRTIQFNALYELNRPALLLNRNTLFIAFGGHCDQGPYHGWLFAYDVSQPKRPKKLAVFCSTPNGKGSDEEGRAGIWMSGEGPAADEAGNIFMVTGDGTSNGATDFGNSVVKVSLAGGSFQAEDWYTPRNQEVMKKDDVDLGSAGAVLVPKSHLLLAAGKEGRIYLLDRDKMGKGAAPPLQTFQITHQPELTDVKSPVYYNIHGTPVIWQQRGKMYAYVNGEEDPVKQYKLVPDSETLGKWKFESAIPFKKSSDCPTAPFCVFAPYPEFPKGVFGKPGREGVWMSGGIMSISANGDEAGSGILWVTMPYMTNANHAVVRGVLRALNASDVSKPELWDSESTGNENDRLGLFAKFCPPTVANGKVYVATFQEEIVGSDHIHKIMPSGDRAALVIYGLKQDDRAISSQRHMVFWRGNFQSISSKQRISPNR
jgi:hypothetical protein